ncbi:MAG: hypothetical protein QG558_1060 [Campylobacterota bacterium]|nr:hypothetical protein [Campylobacterota bacterium]
MAIRGDRSSHTNLKVIYELLYTYDIVSKSLLLQNATGGKKNAIKAQKSYES